MFAEAYKRAFAVLKKKPFRLWGLSLLVGIISIFASVLTFPFLSIVGLAFTMVVGAGMSKVYLDALDNKLVNSDQLFEGFKNFWRVLGGIAWKKLWMFIWGFITLAAGGVVMLIFAMIGAAFTNVPSFGYYSPSAIDAIAYRMAGAGAGAFMVIGVILAVLVWIAGIVFTIYKSYSYRFVEYILMTEDVSATEALRKSVKMTKGLKGQMFVADFLFKAGIYVAALILGLFSAIPYIGSIFGIVTVVFFIVVLLFTNIFVGLYSAAFYKMPVANQENMVSIEEKFAEKLDNFETEETQE